MSVSSSVKLFALIISATVLFYYIMTGDSVDLLEAAPNDPHSKDQPRYILDWRQILVELFNYPGRGNSGLKQNYCPMYPNCFLTNDRELLPDLRDFDAILFHGFKLPELRLIMLPQSRSPKQKYIFSTMESADDNPICDPHYDDYFNWTWTYRLDSDLLWAYFIVHDLIGNMVAPDVNVTWTPTYQPLSDRVRSKLTTKSKAAAWFVSHCKTSSKREDFAKTVSRHLREYNLYVDVYGGCSKDLQCPKGYWYCEKMIETDYYFYFAFENSFDEDYVTEKILNAVNNLAVPVVYGGADYSRFLPPGSYLDGRKLGAKLLARTMWDIIQNRTRYEDMFRWRNHYEIKAPFMVDVCELCAKLTHPEELARLTIYDNFRKWWNQDSKLCEGWQRNNDL